MCVFICSRRGQRVGQEHVAGSEIVTGNTVDVQCWSEAFETKRDRSYVGEYQLTPQLSLAITLKDGRLIGTAVRSRKLVVSPKPSITPSSGHRIHASVDS